MLLSIINSHLTCTVVTNGGVESLIDIGLSNSTPVASEYIGVPATSSDPVLDDFLASENSSTKVVPAKKEEASLDDFEFWLSTDNKPAVKVATLYISDLQFV